VNLTPVDAGSPSRRISRPLLVAGIAFAFLIAAAFRWLTLTEFLNDHFDHVALAQQLRLGSMPVRDFVDEGMPLMYVVSAAVWSLVKAPFLAEAISVELSNRGTIVAIDHGRGARGDRATGGVSAHL
jgi:hypothetical protein